MPPGELTGFGTGKRDPIYARAAVLGDDAGRPTIEAALLTDAYRRYKQGDDATDLILVAADAALALLVPLPPGLTLAGIVAEQMVAAGFSSPLPTVSGVGSATRQIADGELLILDAESGRVLIEPAPEEFVRLQTERRRPRILLGDRHMPAQTQSGRVVDVWAAVQDPAGLEAAFAGGADGLLITSPEAFLPEDEDGVMDAAPLLRIAERIGGGPLAILADPEEIDPAVLLAVAPRADLRWVLRPERLDQSPEELRIDLGSFGRAQDDDADQNSTPMTPQSTTELPQLGALLSTSDATTSAFEELYLPASEIIDWTMADTFDLPPLRILLDDGDIDGLKRAVLIGAAGVAVSPDRIAETKDFIREQAY